MKPDRVIIRSSKGEQALSIAEFQAIPVERQVELLLSGQVTFFSGETTIRATEALRMLRAELVASLTR